jgi:hypothetical protein
MTKLFISFFLAMAIVGCRSVPFEVRAAHDDGFKAQKLAIRNVTDVIEAGLDTNATTTQEEVDALRVSYKQEMAKALELRNKVQMWLDSEDIDEASSGHEVLIKTLKAIDANHKVLFDNWTKIKNPDAAGFVAYMKQHLGWSEDLLHRFDDWIRQFKVSGE